MRRFPSATLASLFFRFGTTIFGGGDPTIAAVQREFVERRRVVSAEEYGILYALARITPGTNMLAFCAGIGYVLSGWMGSVIVLLSVTLPSAVIAVILLESFERMMANPVAAAGIASMVAAAVGLMFVASFQLVRPFLAPSRLPRTAVLAAGAFLVAWRGLLSPLEVLGLAAIVGYLLPEPSK
jgi:chromate transporter